MLHGEEYIDEKIVEKIMISLSGKFVSKISAIEESCDLEKTWSLEGSNARRIWNDWKEWNLEDNGKFIGVKWIYRIKLNHIGSIFTHKVRLVVKHYVQTEGVDYRDTFSLVDRHDTIRFL